MTNEQIHTVIGKLLNEELKKGDIFKLNGINPKTMAKMIASKYGANPEDFVPGKNGTIVYQPKRTAKPKAQVVSKPEDMSVEDYKEKFVIPMKPELKDIEGEEWRPVENKNRYFGGDVDYGNYYEISNLGRLRTINLQNAAKSSISVGYDAPTRKAMQFHLNHKSGMNTCPDVKYIVADAFLGEHDLQDNMVVHIDGDYHNNRADNLKWVPRKRNRGNLEKNTENKMNIDSIISESINKVLNEAFEEKYENAIDTVEYYLSLCTNGHQLSQQQAEQLSEIVEWLKETDANDNPSTPQWIEAAEELLSQCQPLNEKSKSGIHINPENKGKFTATKKRTGKTTSELLHSKNPLTRQRANFARNVKKWNHKKSVDENTLSRIIREALDNFQETESTPQQEKWQEILQRINDAGVNQAMPKTQKPQGQQPQSSSHIFQLGNYTFNAAQHRLDTPNGTIYLRGKVSDMLTLFCENMNQTVSTKDLLQATFGVTDFADKDAVYFATRTMNVYMVAIKKLFADNQNVTFSSVRGIGYRLEVKE